ncbi:MAG: hypothetical protein ACOH2B_07625 [Burkholderiaceae bacterium]
MCSELVLDNQPPIGISANGQGDNLILVSAISSGADTICTYNLKDFPIGPVAVRTPLAVHHDSGSQEIMSYVQRVDLSTCGTLLFFGLLHHPSSMGPIIASQYGTKVFADEQGFIRLSGPTIKRCRTLNLLRGNEEFRLSIRFNRTDFEAARWIKVGTDWLKEVLSNGAGAFAENTAPILFLFKITNFPDISNAYLVCRVS